MSNPSKFYRYRYLNCWEAELPVGWTGKAKRLSLSFVDDQGVEAGFTVSTTSKNQLESFRELQKNEPQLDLDWERLMARVPMLGDELAERNPQVENEQKRLKDDCLYRYQSWMFKGKDVLILLRYSYKSEERDPMQVATVKHFVNTLRLVED